MHPGFIRDISVYTTAGHTYVAGYSTEKGCWKLLKFQLGCSPDLEVSEDATRYTLKELDATLRRLHHGNLHRGGLRKVVSCCPALIGCFRWTACYYLLLVTKVRVMGSLAGAKVYGIDATALVPLAPPSEVDPAAAQAQATTFEERCRRLLSLVTLTKDFFFSYDWPLWATVQQTLDGDVGTMEPNAADGGFHTIGGESAIHQAMAFESDRVWNDHLTAPLRAALDTAAWTIPLVHGSWHQRQLSLLGRPLTFTLIARRSKRFAGTRYLRRGVNDDGHVANDVEIEQVVESEAAGRASCLSSVVQVRGSVPLYWSQAGPWDSRNSALRPEIRMLHFLDPLFTATSKHFSNLRRQYGDPIICLDLLRQSDRRRQESVLSTAYASAVAFLNRRLPPEQHITYVAWDLRQRSRTLGASLLADLQKDQAPLLAASGIFAASPVQVQQTQHGVVRTNCVDCLDRTNVAQFAFGLLALGEQLRALGIVSHAGVDLRSSLAGEVMQAWESTGNTLSEQYAGSEAHTGVFQKWRGDWQAARQSRNFLTSIRRFYSNVVTDEDKQHAINLFVGAFIPPAEKSSSRRPSSSGSEREDLAAAGSSSSAMNARLGGVDIDHQTSMSPDAMGPLVATLSSVSLASSACEALVEPTLDQLLTEAAAAAAAHGPSAEVVLAASSSTTSGAQSPEMTPGSRVRSPVGRKPRWVQRAVAAVTPALVSLQHVLPTDVRPVRLVAPRPMSPPSVPWLSPRRPQSSDGAEETRCGDKASAEVPLPPRPPARLVRSNSAGDAADLAAAAASWRSGGGGPTGGGSGGSPALGPSSSTDLIQSLNLEGTNLPPTAGGAGVGKPPGPTPTGGLGGQGKRVSFASFANLRQLVMGGASGASAPGSRAPSRVSSLAGDLATSGESSLGNSVVPSLAGGGQGTRARSERRLVPMPMESMLLQHQAVAHGIDQLGLPGAMAALWLRPNDAMNALAVAEASMASGESVTARAVVPLTPADHAALEKATVAQLQPPFSINAAAF